MLSWDRSRICQTKLSISTFMEISWLDGRDCIGHFCKERISVGCVLPARDGMAIGSLPDRDPPKQRPPGQRPPGQRPPGQRPLERDLVDTDPLDRDPQTETPRQRPPWTERPTLDRDPPVNIITDRCKNITLPKLRQKKTDQTDQAYGFQMRVLLTRVTMEEPAQ